MLKHILLATAVCASLFSCSDSSEDLENKEAIGGPRYGGEFRFMSSEKVKTLLPLQAIEIYSNRITSQLFDPILRLDESGENVIPGLAESFSVSQDGKEYTIKVRKGVFFQEDDCFGGEGRELTAHDIKFTLDMACSGLKFNEVSGLLIDRIEGAKKFHDATATSFKESGVSGITVSDNSTLKIKLLEPFSGFDKLLTYSGFGVFPKEAYDEYGDDLPNHPVGTGPFQLEEKTDKQIRLIRNNNYWRKDEFGNQLPFLGSIVMTYSSDKHGELKSFRNAEIDLVLEIPADQVENILGSLQEAQAGKTVKHKVDSEPSASMTFIGLANAHPEFKDVRVRKAFNMAIDRVMLVNDQLMGEGYPVEHGFIPNCTFFDASGVKGHKFDPAKAQQLMAEAGYKNGEGFPKVTLIYSGKKNSDRAAIAKAVASQLKANLNVDIQVKNVTITERDQLVSSGKADMWVSQWIADYPDGENFLNLFASKNIPSNSSFMNPFNYRSTKFDQLLDKANREKDPVKRGKYLQDADQVLVDDAVVIPILSDDFVTMINSRIRNFNTNSLEVLDLSSIFIKEPKN